MSVDKVVFFLSLVLFAFLYGFAANSRGWFPASLLERAWKEARAVSPWHSQRPFFLFDRVYERQGARTLIPDEVDPALTLVASVFRDTTGWTPGLKLIDREGKVLHEWRVRPGKLIPDSANRKAAKVSNLSIDGSYLFPSGDILVNLEYGGTVRLDACSDLRWRLLEGGHHSIEREDDGSFWIPGTSKIGPAKSELYPNGYPGIKGPIYHDEMLRVSPAGDVIERIKILDVLYENRLERYLPHAMWSRFEDKPYGQDVVHLNDIEPLSDTLAAEYPMFEAGDLLVSMRKANLVLVLDPESQEVKWHAYEPFIHQHDPDYLGDGWIGIFDNNQDGTERGTMLGGSRILALQPHTGSSKTLFPTPQSEQFYTHILGKWQKISNGNLLLTEAVTGRVVEVTPEGRTIWEWIVPPYDEKLVPNVTEATRVQIGRERVSRWPCSEKRDSE